MSVITTRFGDMQVSESKIIHMKGGILGFEQATRYLLFMQNKEIPFGWFVSADNPSIAFVVINSFVAEPEYEPVIPDSDAELLEITSPEDAVVLSVVTINSNPFSVTVNLAAPIVINAQKMLAKQIVLNDQRYSLQHSITDKKTLFEKETGDRDDALAAVTVP